MSRFTVFTFRIAKDERRLLAELAKHLQRSQSDTVRLLIREAMRELISEGRSFHQTSESQGLSNDTN